MRMLAWLLVRHPRTVAIAELDLALRGELKERATCGLTGQPAPHQPELPTGTQEALAVLVMIWLLHLAGL